MRLWLAGCWTPLTMHDLRRMSVLPWEHAKVWALPGVHLCGFVGKMAARTAKLMTLSSSTVYCSAGEERACGIAVHNGP